MLALGGSSSRFKGALFDENGAAKVQGVLEMDCGEGMDTARLQLPGNQNELFTAVCALKKPVISVVIAGRPYAIPEIAQDSDALLYAFYPGPMGGKAIAELLSGNMHRPADCRCPFRETADSFRCTITIRCPIRQCTIVIWNMEFCIHLGKEWDIPTWSMWISVLKAAGCVDYFRNCKE